MTDVGPADLTLLARRLPKADLHSHLIGNIRASTASALGRRHGIEYPVEPEVFYPRINSVPAAGRDYRGTAVPMPPMPAAEESSDPGYSLLGVSEWIADALVDAADFERVAYEAVADSRRESNVRHLELHVEVGAYLSRGVTYRTIVDGLSEGLDAALLDFGTSARLIVGIDRSKSAATAVAVVGEAVAAPSRYVVGIGLDNLETAGPADRFVEAYRLAAENGLRRTAHAGEHEPTAANVEACLDLLGCERIDHGYFVLEDRTVLARARDSGVAFTCIFTTSRRSWRPWRRESIARMVDLGLPVVLASDDPALFPTTLAAEYELAIDALGVDTQGLVQLARRSIDASWLEDDAKTSLRREFDIEVHALLGC